MRPSIYSELDADLDHLKFSVIWQRTNGSLSPWRRPGPIRKDGYRTEFILRDSKGRYDEK